MKKLKYWAGLILFLPALVQAHGLVTTQSQIVGDHVIEFEYNTIGNILTGDYTLFDVYLLDKEKNGVDFDSAFIRIEKQNGSAVLAGNLAEASDLKGYASISGVLNDPGIYTAEVSFYKAGKVLSDAKFDFQAEPNQAAVPVKDKKSFVAGAYALGLVMGAAGFWLIKKSLKKKS